MKDGLFKVEFKTSLGSGAGMMVLAGGNVWGADTRFYYVGRYTQAGNQLVAEIKTNVHTNAPGPASIFGNDHVTVKFAGNVADENLVQMNGTSPDAPSVACQAVMRRLA